MRLIPVCRIKKIGIFMCKGETNETTCDRIPVPDHKGRDKSLILCGHIVDREVPEECSCGYRIPAVRYRLCCLDL